MGILDQFEHPHGRTGRLVGWILTWANRSINVRLIEMLSLEGRERVLELGYGPGVALELMARRLPQGHLTGIDPSSTMHDQAAKRNQRLVAEDRLDLRVGTPPPLPFPDGSFDVVYSANNVQLWDPFDGTLAEIYRVLRPGGRLAIAVQGVAARAQGGSLGGDISELDRSLRQHLGTPLWEGHRSKVLRVWLGRSLLVIARRPGTAPP